MIVNLLLQLTTKTVDLNELNKMIRVVCLDNPSIRNNYTTLASHISETFGVRCRVKDLHKYDKIELNLINKKQTTSISNNGYLH